MPFTDEQNAFILKAHYRSGTLREDGEWSYSLQSCLNQFRENYPNHIVSYKIFAQHKDRVIRRFETKNCICKGVLWMHLTSAHQSFNDKQKNIFDELNKVNVVLPQQKISPSEERRNEAYINPDQSLKCLRGKESIFKRPEVPIRKCLPTRKMPDFKKNPHKWTKYSLNDVKDEDISEKGNTKAALAFLKELEKRNSRVNDIAKFSNKITFQKSALIANIDNAEQKQTFKSSKVVMPEYVVGQKIKKEKKNKSIKYGQATKQLILAHLAEEDEEN